MAELELFRAALLAAEPPFAVLHIYGPGGVGKTTLLREYARVAAESGRPVLHLDGRNVDSSPTGFLLALRQSMGLEEGELSSTLSDWPSTSVLLIDTYETLGPVDAWLRETFLPQLPAHSLVVIAGRNPPAPAWRTDIDWADLTQIVSLRNLRPEESQTYLATCGIPDDQHADALAFTHGHPLALTLVADVLRQGDRLAAFNPASEPDVVRALLERLVQDVPSVEHRLALEVCALAWATTEAMLADVLDVADTHALFEWLRRLSFIEHGRYGLFPHDLAREVLDADLRWRNPDRYWQLKQRMLLYLRSRFAQTSGVDQQRLRLDMFFISRHDPGMKPFFAWDVLDSAYAEPAASEDAPAILATVRAHEGEASAQIAQYWLRRQPEAFLVFRDHSGEVVGFMANLVLRQATPDDLAVDPAVPAALNFAERYGPVRPGEEIVHLRFWMARETYQAVSPTINLTAINSVIYWMTHPKLAWNFITMANPEFWQPHFASIDMCRSPEADFEVDGRHYGVFTHDWRVQSVAAWQARQRMPPADLSQELLPKPLSLPVLVLSHTDFAESVRQALRDYTRPDRLATNPLIRSRLVVDAARLQGAPTALAALLREAATTLTANHKDTKFHRAVWHTYFEPAPTQERAAELLNLPFNTYRYHLANGIERITEWLWQRELNGPDR